MNPQAVLQPLRKAVEDRNQPLFPDRLEPTTPRRASRALSTPEMARKMALWSSPTRKAVEDAKTALNVAIATQQQLHRWQEAQKQKIEAEALKSNPRRHVRVDNGAFTIEELRERVEQRNIDETVEFVKETQKKTVAFLKEIALEEGNTHFPKLPPRRRQPPQPEPFLLEVFEGEGVVGPHGLRIDFNHPEYDTVLL